MIRELVCPNCHVGLDERQLVTSTSTVESCPYCRALVTKQESFRWQNRDALILEDVAALGAWLDSVVSTEPFRVVRRADEEANGKYVWEIVDVGIGGTLYPWTCTVEYSSDKANIVAVRLMSSQNGQGFVEDPERLRFVCAEHGLQPYTERRLLVDWSSQQAEIRWGVQQLLATNPLSVALFQAVLQRLEQAMRDVAAQLVSSGPS